MTLKKKKSFYNEFTLEKNSRNCFSPVSQKWEFPFGGIFVRTSLIYIQQKVNVREII